MLDPLRIASNQQVTYTMCHSINITYNISSLYFENQNQETFNVKINKYMICLSEMI